MIEVPYVVALGIGALLLGIAIGYLTPRAGLGRKGRVAELKDQLEASQEELADYKRQVFEQFGETAEKFRALNKSYDDLHRQLAQSAVALCGDAATPLLDAPTEAALADADEASMEEPIEGEAETILVAESEDTEDVAVEVGEEAPETGAGEPVESTEPDAAAEEAARAEAGDAEAEGEAEEAREPAKQSA